MWAGAADGGKTGGFKGGVLAACVALAVFLATESWILVRRLRAGPRARFGPVDAVNLLPTGVLLGIGSVLYGVLRGHPNWPAGGYLVMTVGAVAALLGMGVRRTRPVAPVDTRVASPGRAA